MSTSRYLAEKEPGRLCWRKRRRRRTGLNRTLGPWRLTALGIGAIIGAGIFVLTGQAAAQYAGPAIMLSFMLGGIACAFAGLCYAEFAALIPVAGSAYTYAYATLGEMVAWVIGWDLVLEYALGTATVAVGWSGYVVSFLTLPPMLTAAAGLPAGGHALLNLLALIGVLGVTALLVLGVQESSQRQRRHRRRQALRHRRVPGLRRGAPPSGELAPVPAA